MNFNETKKNIIIFILIGLLTVMVIMKFLKKPSGLNFYQKMRKSECNSVEFLKNDEIVSIINYNTSWCHYSKIFQPVWDQLTKDYQTKNIKIVDMKCDKKENEKFCNKAKIRYYPTIKIYTKDHIADYMDEKRDLESLKKFIKDNIGDI